jgi:hypothetical protein
MSWFLKFAGKVNYLALLGNESTVCELVHLVLLVGQTNNEY